MRMIFTRSRVYRSDLAMFARAQFLTELPDGSFVAEAEIIIGTERIGRYQWPVYHAMPPRPIYVDDTREFAEQQYALLIERTVRFGSGGRDDDQR